FFFFFSSQSSHHRVLPSFPTRRSSDLGQGLLHDASLPLVWKAGRLAAQSVNHVAGSAHQNRSLTVTALMSRALQQAVSDGNEIRSESTRLNSSHLVISYAVFCLKKKKK